MKAPSLALCAALLAAGCTGAQRDLTTAESWPEADALFRSEPDWLGGDAAFSVHLGGERTLWLFGDSFIATSAAHIRSESEMVRNSIALQHGLNPESATIEFSWRDHEGRPGSFFPEQDDTWLWPLHGIVHEGELTVFLSRIENDSDPSSLGFRAVGWTAIRVEELDDNPMSWELREMPIPETPFPAIVGVSVIRTEGFVYAWVVEEPGSHALFLLRWREERVAAGDLTEPEWWAGTERGFVAADDAAPVAVLSEGATELSVSRARHTEGWVLVQTRGFGAATLSLRRAEHLVGPWSDLEALFRPPESSRSDAFVYAGKGHPQLEGADLVATYAANAWDFSDLVADDSLYYPRFIRISFAEPEH